MRMRELPDGLTLPAGQAVALTPGGFHIMLLDLKQPLVAGQTVPVQLRFRTAPPLDLQLKVRADRGTRSGPGAGWRDADAHADGRDAGTREVMGRAKTVHAGASRPAGGRAGVDCSGEGVPASTTPATPNPAANTTWTTAASSTW